MKKNYVSPEMEVLSFGVSDIVTQSLSDGDVIVDVGGLFGIEGSSAEWI